MMDKKDDQSSWADYRQFTQAVANIWAVVG